MGAAWGRTGKFQGGLSVYRRAQNFLSFPSPSEFNLSHFFMNKICRKQGHKTNSPLLPQGLCTYKSLCLKRRPPPLALV